MASRSTLLYTKNVFPIKLVSKLYTIPGEVTFLMLPMPQNSTCVRVNLKLHIHLSLRPKWELQKYNSKSYKSIYFLKWQEWKFVSFDKPTSLCLWQTMCSFNGWVIRWWKACVSMGSSDTKIQIQNCTPKENIKYKWWQTTWHKYKYTPCSPN